MRPDNTQLVGILRNRDVTRVVDSDDRPEPLARFQVDLHAADAARYGYRGLG